MRVQGTLGCLKRLDAHYEKRPACSTYLNWNQEVHVIAVSVDKLVSFLALIRIGMTGDLSH